MITSLSFWLGVLAVLASYLYASVVLRLWLRHRAWERAERVRLTAIAREFRPQAFEAAAVSPRMRHIRQEYISSARHRLHPTYFRAELLEATRQLVTRLGYFRRARVGSGFCRDEPPNPPS